MNRIEKLNLIWNNKFTYPNFNPSYPKYRIDIICNDCTNSYNVNYYDHLNKQSGCKHCNVQKLKDEKSNKNFISDSISKFGDKFDYSKVVYVNNRTDVIISCEIHGEIEMRPYNHLKSKTGCKHCGDAVTKSKETRIKEFNIVHNNKYSYPYDFPRSNKGEIVIVCNIHGEFPQRIDNHLSGKGCPKCNSSKGELKIIQYLEQNNIQYQHLKKFDNCVYNKKLIFDFYLEDYNLCIEYDGEHHFKPVNFKGGCSNIEHDFEQVKMRDLIKTEYCINNNIQLLRISYVDYEKIEEILYELLKI